jgi:hypothetical protein
MSSILQTELVFVLIFCNIIKLIILKSVICLKLKILKRIYLQILLNKTKEVKKPKRRTLIMSRLKVT